MMEALGRLQRLLSLSGRLERIRAGELLLGRAWELSERFEGRQVVTRLHHQPVRMLYGNPYLRWMRRYPLYNAPFVELVHLAAGELGRPVRVVDVGAAVGDTALLLLASCPEDIEHIICVEGDHAFLEMLRWNTSGLSRVSIMSVLLSDGSGVAAKLVRTHAGTASPQGTPTAGRPLDEVTELAEPDVIKVDTDGFDGRVLQGAAATLDRARPHVIFEWHPVLLEATRSDPAQPFEVLKAAGYSRCVWFTKEGAFSHVTTSHDAARSCDRLAAVCRALGPADIHYDVVALPDGSSLQEERIAELDFARRHRHDG